MKTIEQLTQEYANWVESKGYPSISADELLAEERDGEMLVSDSQDREWLYAFVQQWEDASSLNTYSVTIIVKDLGVRETYKVSAEDEWKARTVAQMMANHSLSGQFVEYEVEQI